MIGHEALLTAANIAKDTLAGKNLFKPSVKPPKSTDLNSV